VPLRTGQNSPSHRLCLKAHYDNIANIHTSKQLETNTEQDDCEYTWV